MHGGMFMSAFLIIVGLACVIVGAGRLVGRMRWAHITRRRDAAIVTVVGLVFIVAGGGLAGGNKQSPSSGPVPSPSARHSPSALAPQRTARGTAPRPRHQGASQSSASSNASHAPRSRTSLPRPSPRTITGPGGITLPDSRLTPGAVFAGAARAHICTPGWVEAHRDVPDATVDAVFAEYRISYGRHASYEVDHLIPLELGGSNSVTNLWPQPEGGSRPGYPSKDRLENHLHALVCSGRLALATAQREIAVNWWMAYQTYINVPVSVSPPPARSPTPAPHSPGPVPTSARQVVHPGAFCSVPGARGVTTRGTPMVCRTTTTDSRLRWRHA